MKIKPILILGAAAALYITAVYLGRPCSGPEIKIYYDKTLKPENLSRDGGMSKAKGAGNQSYGPSSREVLEKMLEEVRNPGDLEISLDYGRER